MKKVPIRWGNFVFTAAFVGGILAFFLIFLDPLLKRALIAAGEKAALARVEIADLHTQIFKGKLTIRGLAVADKESPMTNLVEFKEAVFQLLPAPILEKKFVIEEASITGLTWGTPRKTSGMLPPRKQKKVKPEDQPVIARKVTQAVTTTQDFGLSRVEAAKSASQDKVDSVKPENLNSLKVLDEGKGKAAQLGEDWKTQASAQEEKFKTLSDEVKKDIETLKASGGSSDIKEIAERAKKIKEIQSKIKAGQKDLEETKKRAQADLAQVKQIAQEAKAAKEKDLEALRSLLGLPSLDADSIARMLLGDVINKKLGRILSIFETAKKYMPAKSEEMPKVQDQDRGIYVLFPKENVYPTFLWKKALIAGTAPLPPVPLEFKGELNDIAILPKQWKKPLTAQAHGKQGTRELKIDALADHRNDNFKDTLELKLAGVSVAGFELGEGKELGATLKEGLSTLTLNVKRANDLWEGSVTADVAQAVLEPRLNVKGALGSRLGDAVRSIHNFNVSVSFRGVPEDLDFSLRSDLGKQLSETLKAMLSSEVNAQKKALEDKVNGLYTAKAAEFEQMLQSKQSEILKPLEGRESALKKLLGDSTGLSSSPSGEKPADEALKKIKKLFK